MSYYGSYRKLLANADAAMVAAIELYNKPLFMYREECVVILLINAWELLLKAILSKNKISLYRPKKREQGYMFLSLSETIRKVENLKKGSKGELRRAVVENLWTLKDYRNEFIHFYNDNESRLTLYMLFQANIKNFRDIMYENFGKKLEDKINWRILPLGVTPPIDVISYLNENMANDNSVLTSKLIKTIQSLNNRGEDIDGLIIGCKVQIESVSRAAIFDAKVAIDNQNANSKIVVERQDPNKSHPHRQKEVLSKIGEKLDGYRFNSYVFQAIVFYKKLKENKIYTWCDDKGGSRKYSEKTIELLKSLKHREIEAAISHYKKKAKKQKK